MARGRPKGSKNRVNNKKGDSKHSKISISPGKKRGPGRPKGSTKKVQVKKVQVERVRVEVRRRKSPKRTYLGDCSCGVMIMGADKFSSTMYICPGCEKKKLLSKFKKKSKVPKFENRKEYFASTINVEHHDMPPMIDAIDISKPLSPA